MNTQTKKIHIELDEEIVDNFVFHLLNTKELERVTQSWSSFNVRSKKYCERGCAMYRNANEKLCKEIERKTGKKVLCIGSDLSVSFEDGTRLRIVL